jgi:tetratricopeptide (TPR) repeat protein
MAYNHKEDADKAIADCNQAIKLDPKFTWAYSDRCWAYNIKGDYDSAIADCS